MNSFDKEKTAKEFGLFIREERERRGLLQAEVAEMIGVSRGYYGHIEGGTRDIYFTLAMKICKTLNLDINDFAQRIK